METSISKGTVIRIMLPSDLSTVAIDDCLVREWIKMYKTYTEVYPSFLYISYEILEKLFMSAYCNFSGSAYYSFSGEGVIKRYNVSIMAVHGLKHNEAVIC